MAAVDDTGVPGLTQILTWDTGHLHRAAVDWTSTGEQWEEIFTGVHRGMLSPGGTVWEGNAAEAAQERSFADLVKVRGLSDVLHEAAAIARRGADQLDYLKHQAIDAIAEAEEAGFAVGEDLTVTDPRPIGALRVGQLREHAETIRARAMALGVADKEIASSITTAAGELAHHGFNEAPGVQAVDYHQLKQEPPPDPGAPDPSKQVHDGYDADDLLKQFQRGKNQGIRQVEWAEDIRRLYEQLVKNSVGEAPSTKTPYGDGGPRLGRVLDDGTIIRFRETSGSGGPTIDVQYPWGGGRKVHLPLGGSAPIISDLPNVPPVGSHPPTMFAPPQTGHPLPQLPPPSILDPNGLPPWLQTSSPPGISLLPAQPPMLMPGVALPTTPPPSSSMPGPTWIDSVGHGLADAGRTAATGALVGIAVIGGLLAAGVTDAGQLAP